MPTRLQVTELRDGGLSYEQVAERLGINPGLAHLIATGSPSGLGDPPMHSSAAQAVVHRWISGRAAADAQMQAAAAARDRVPVEPPVRDDSRDPLATLAREHNAVMAMSKQLATIPAGGQGGSVAQISQRVSLIDTIRSTFSRLVAFEAEFLWPAVRRGLPDGAERAEMARRQERETTGVLTALSAADPATDDHLDLVEQLITQLRRHVAFEDKIFLELGSVDHQQSRHVPSEYEES